MQFTCLISFCINNVFGSSSDFNVPVQSTVLMCRYSLQF